MELSISEEWLKRKLEKCDDSMAEAGLPVDWRAAYEEEARKFHQETLRTSAFAVILREWIERHEGEHEPGARGCEVCDLVLRSRELLTRPINE